jgi:hypothetical protein
MLAGAFESAELWNPMPGNLVAEDIIAFEAARMVSLFLF